MSIVIDLIIVGIVLLFAVISAKKGFVKTVVEMVGFVAAIVIALTVSAPIAEFTYDKVIEPPILASISQEATDNVSGIVNDIWEKMPEFIITKAEEKGHTQERVTESINAGMSSGAQTAVKATSQNVFKPIATSLLGLVFSAIIAIVLILLVKPIAKIVNGIFSFSIIGKANRALGAVVGILKGAVFAVVFCLLINLIISFSPNGILIFTPENIADSYAFKLLAEAIPFIKF